jgi:hypothetical protein
MISVFCGKGKPDSLEKLLRPFLAEQQKLEQND